MTFAVRVKTKRINPLPFIPLLHINKRLQQKQTFVHDSVLAPIR